MRLVGVLVLSFVLLSCGGTESDLVPADNGAGSESQPAVSESDENTTPSDEPPATDVPALSDAPPNDDPAIDNSDPNLELTGIVLMAASESSGELLDLMALADGAEIDLSQISGKLINFSVTTEENSDIQSVSLQLEGPRALSRTENSAPFLLANESSNIDISTGELPLGSYTLTAVSYSEPDGSGALGERVVINFSVINSGQPPANSVPPILAATLVSASADDDDGGGFSEVARLVDGFTIDLADFDGLTLNVLAESQNRLSTGSVQFNLSGPVSIDRFENNYVYSLAAEPENLDADGVDLPVGDYDLVITPYSEPNIRGEAGTTFNVSFTVVNSGSTPIAEPAPEPEPEPTEPEISVTGDFYVVNVGSVLEISAAQGLGRNDDIDPSLAVFSLETQAENGRLELDIDGGFTYTPNDSFEGLDTFTYHVEQGDVSASAEVSVRVLAESSTAGFTAITPSADSRVIYVSSSQGNDANSCLSEAEPCASIAEGIEKMRSGLPDHLLLRRGDRWRVGTRALDGIPSGRSPSEKSILGYYGNSGPRPIIEAPGTVYREDNRDVRHLAFLGLHFYGYLKDPSNPEFNPSARDANVRFITRFTDILVEDCKFEFAGMTIQTFGGHRPRDMVIRRNIFAGVYENESSSSRSARPSNVFTHGVDGQRFEDNVFDFGGWHPTVPGAGANQLAHNVYMQWQSDGNSTFFINNISVRGASHGIQMRAGGLAQDNFFARNSIGLLMGYDFNDREPPAGTIAHAIDNVITEGNSMQSKGVDSCQTGNVCTSAHWGLNVVVNSDADFQAHGNLVANAIEEDRFRSSVALNFGFRNGRTDFPNTNNIGFAWRDPNEGTNPSFPDPTRTLADYNAFLGGNNDFDEFMDIVKNRPLGTWDERYTARAINAYIRAGFE